MNLNMKETLKMAARSWIMMAAMAFIEIMFFPALATEYVWLNIIINVAVLLAALMFAFANGANMGESEVTYIEMLKKRVNNGYVAEEYDRVKCYNRKRAVIAMLLGALPWVIISVVVMVSGIGQTHAVVAEETVQYLFPEQTEVVMTTHQVIDMVARICFSAFIGFYAFVDGAMPGLLDYLFLPMSFIYPMALMIGYLCGPWQHQKKLKFIEEGKKKKLRKIRAAQKRKRNQNNQPKPEV